MIFCLFKFSNWNKGEPNNDNEGENCTELIMSSNLNQLGKWNDISCDQIERKYICQKRIIKKQIEIKQHSDSTLFLLSYLKFVILKIFYLS